MMNRIRAMRIARAVACALVAMMLLSLPMANGVSGEYVTQKGKGVVSDEGITVNVDLSLTGFAVDQAMLNADGEFERAVGVGVLIGSATDAIPDGSFLPGNLITKEAFSKMAMVLNHNSASRPGAITAQTPNIACVDLGEGTSALIAMWNSSTAWDENGELRFFFTDENGERSGLKALLPMQDADFGVDNRNAKFDFENDVLAFGDTTPRRYFDESYLTYQKLTEFMVNHPAETVLSAKLYVAQQDEDASSGKNAWKLDESGTATGVINGEGSSKNVLHGIAEGSESKNIALNFLRYMPDDDGKVKLSTSDILADVFSDGNHISWLDFVGSLKSSYVIDSFGSDIGIGRAGSFGAEYIVSGEVVSSNEVEFSQDSEGRLYYNKQFVNMANGWNIGNSTPDTMLMGTDGVAEVLGAGAVDYTVTNQSGEATRIQFELVEGAEEGSPYRIDGMKINSGGGFWDSFPTIATYELRANSKYLETESGLILNELNDKQASVTGNVFDDAKKNKIPTAFGDVILNFLLTRTELLDNDDYERFLTTAEIKPNGDYEFVLNEEAVRELLGPQILHCDFYLSGAVRGIITISIVGEYDPPALMGFTHEFTKNSGEYTATGDAREGIEYGDGYGSGKRWFSWIDKELPEWLTVTRGLPGENIFISAALTSTPKEEPSGAYIIEIDTTHSAVRGLKSGETLEAKIPYGLFHSKGGFSGFYYDLGVPNEGPDRGGFVQYNTRDPLYEAITVIVHGAGKPAACNKEGHTEDDGLNHSYCSICKEYKCKKPDKKHGNGVCGYFIYCEQCKKKVSSAKQHLLACEHYSCDTSFTQGHGALGCGHLACKVVSLDDHALLGCDKHYACEGGNHGKLNCGHYECTSGDHALLGCGKHYACESGNHGKLPCGHYECVGGDHALLGCDKHYACEGGNHEKLPCGHFECTGGDHDKLPCGEHYACEGGSHVKLDCGHYECDGGNHGRRACGHLECDSGDHGKLSCGVHYACDEDSAPDHSLLGCGHRACSGGDHSRLDCDHLACDTSYPQGHSLLGCGHRACSGGDHSRLNCGHYTCDPAAASMNHSLHACGESDFKHYHCNSAVSGLDHSICSHCGSGKCTAYLIGKHDKMAPCGVHYQCAAYAWSEVHSAYCNDCGKYHCAYSHMSGGHAANCTGKASP